MMMMAYLITCNCCAVSTQTLKWYGTKRNLCCFGQFITVKIEMWGTAMTILFTWSLKIIDCKEYWLWKRLTCSLQDNWKGNSKHIPVWKSKNREIFYTFNGKCLSTEDLRAKSQSKNSYLHFLCVPIHLCYNYLYNLGTWTSLRNGERTC